MTERSLVDQEIAARVAALHRFGANDRTDALAGLLDVTRRGRRARVRRRRTLGGVTTLAIAVLALVSTVTFVHLRDSRPVQPASNVDRLVGTYSADVSATASGLSTLSGHWQLDLGSDGALAVVAPKGFRGISTGFHFSTEGDQLRVDLFIQDLCTGLPAGTYTWRRDATGLHLSTVADPCAARTTLLTGHPWKPGP